MPALLSKNVGKEILTKSAAKEIGDMVKREMLDLISKGISPVRSAGRFPGYLAVGAARDQKARGKTMRGLIKGADGAAKVQQLNREARAAEGKVKDILSKGYPYSVMGQYKDKRIRPVNLHLSGEMLNDLKFNLVQGKYGFAIEVGYFTSLSAKKESGHREGVGGQPSRPTIPDSSRGEFFAVRISRLLKESFLKAMNDFIKKPSK